MEPEKPKTEGERVAEVRAAGREVAIAWAVFVGAVRRAYRLVNDATDAGQPGTDRHLPTCAAILNAADPKLWATFHDIVDREFAGRDEIQKAFDGTN